MYSIVLIIWHFIIPLLVVFALIALIRYLWRKGK